MKNKKNIVAIVCILFMVVILALASSYALFTFNVTKDTDFKLAIGSLELSITDTNTEDKYILENVVPTKDEVALEQDGYNFTIKNTGTIDSYYTIYLDDILISDLGERLDNSYIKLNLLNKDTNSSNTSRLTDFSSSDRILATGYLEPDESVSYTLRMWLDYEAGNDAQNKYFATQIRLVGMQKNSTEY